MPEGYLHLTCEQRCQIYALLQSGHSQAHIARQIGVDPSTISRELVRNTGARGYRFKQAHEKASQRREEASDKPRKMTPDLVELIEEKLTQEQWSPDQISGRLAKDGVAFISHERIYQHVCKDKKDGGTLYLHLRHSGKKYNRRKGKNSGRGLIPNRVDIDQRPPIVAAKSRIGDWEADTIIGANHKGVVMSHVERTSKYTKLAKLPDKYADSVVQACARVLLPLADRIETITYDNGKEFASHAQIATSLGALSYFAKPYYSWERGLNEQAVLPKRFRPLYFVRCQCPKGRGQTQLSPQKDTRLPNPSRDFLQRQKSARCTSLLNGRHVSDGKMHEVNVLDLMTPEPGSFSIMDRGFLDFARLYRLTQAGAFFVIRPKSNTAFQRVYSRSVDKTTGLRCDQTVRLTGVTSANDHPQYLRYVVFCDEENDKRLGFFTNNFELPALTIAQLYKCRWQVELFFKWIKQHLRIKAFFGTNENAVKTQIWIAISVYVLVAIVKKRLGVAASLYTILQILSLALFEKTPLDQLLNDAALQNLDPVDSNQLNFFS